MGLACWTLFLFDEMLTFLILNPAGRASRIMRVFGKACALSFVLGCPLVAEPGALNQPALNNAAVLPDLGDGSDMAPVAERRLGDRIARELYRDPDYLDDPVIMDYVQGIWLSLIAASRARGEMPDALYDAYAWEILAGRDRTVNAFALPGGYFGLHLGLVGLVETRDELASVLAHELSHVTQRHISRSMARQSAQAPWLLGAMILGMIAASRDANTAQAVVVGGQATAAQSQLNYSRGMEREADRIGFNVSTQAGYAPQGFVSMFEKLQLSSRLNDAGGFPYLRTHPLTTERIADMQTRVQQLPGATLQNPAKQEPLMIAARARVLSNMDVDALRLWRQQAAPENLSHVSVSAQIATLYGASLAALQLRDYALVHATLARLLKGPLFAALEPAAQRLVRLLELETALAEATQNGAPQRAIELAQGLDVSQRAGLLLTSQARVQGGQADAAAQLLQSWVTDHPRDATAWQLLAAAYNAQGMVVAGVRADAEAHFAHFDYAGALARLKAAQDLLRKGGPTSDYIDGSIIDTRVHQIELLLKEQALER